MSKCEQCIIRQANSLKELTKEELSRMSKFKSSKTIKKGEVIFEEGERVNGIYCVKSGICKISKMSDNGKDQIIHLVKQGDLLGERSLISNEAANLKATAVNDMEVCFVPKEEILKDLEENHNFTLAMLKNMANSLKSADNVIVDMAQKSVQQRLALTLVYLDENFKKNEDGSLNVSLSREDIASLIGTATESAIRLLSKFKKDKLINLKGKKITVLDKNSLRSIAEGF